MKLSIPHSGQRCTRLNHAGFTLVELIVVIVILAVLLWVSATGLIAMLRASALNNAINQVSAKIAMTRAMAQRDGEDTVLLFTQRSADENEPTESIYEMRILRPKAEPEVDTDDVDDDGDATEKVLVLEKLQRDDFPVEDLPANIHVHGPDLAGGWRDADDIDPPTTEDPWLAVWFGPDGRVRMSRADGYSEMIYTIEGNKGDAIPMPYLVMYDDLEFQKSGVANEDTWIDGDPSALPPIPPATDARILTFNRYTGILMPDEPN